MNGFFHLLVSNSSLSLERSNSPRTTERSSFVERPLASLRANDFWQMDKSTRMWNNASRITYLTKYILCKCTETNPRECETQRIKDYLLNTTDQGSRITYLTQWAAVTTQLRAIRVAPHPPSCKRLWWWWQWWWWWWGWWRWWSWLSVISTHLG